MTDADESAASQGQRQACPRYAAPLFFGILLCSLLGVGLAWWGWQGPQCGPNDAGKLWFAMEGTRTTIVAYCDEERRYVRPAVPLVVPSPE